MIVEPGWSSPRCVGQAIRKARQETPGQELKSAEHRPNSFFLRKISVCVGRADIFVTLNFLFRNIRGLSFLRSPFWGPQKCFKVLFVQIVRTSGVYSYIFSRLCPSRKRAFSSIISSVCCQQIRFLYIVSYLLTVLILLSFVVVLQMILLSFPSGHSSLCKQWWLSPSPSSLPLILPFP